MRYSWLAAVGLLFVFGCGGKKEEVSPFSLAKRGIVLVRDAAGSGSNPEREIRFGTLTRIPQIASSSVNIEIAQEEASAPMEGSVVRAGTAEFAFNNASISKSAESLIATLSLDNNTYSLGLATSGAIQTAASRLLMRESSIRYNVGGVQYQGVCIPHSWRGSHRIDEKEILSAEMSFSESLSSFTVSIEVMRPVDSLGVRRELASGLATLKVESPSIPSLPTVTIGYRLNDRMKCEFPETFSISSIGNAEMSQSARSWRKFIASLCYSQITLDVPIVERSPDFTSESKTYSLTLLPR